VERRLAGPRSHRRAPDHFGCDSDRRITIHGERKREHEALPQGAISDQAKANFKNGVLEITMPAPSEQVTRGRRLEISEGSEHKK
jgi:hypothetical protein